MGGSGDEIPAQALSRFAAAEARLYPMALTDPVGYQLATTLVGLVADELRRSTVDVATVVDRRAELVDLVPRLAAGGRSRRRRHPGRGGRRRGVGTALPRARWHRFGGVRGRLTSTADLP